MAVYNASIHAMACEALAACGKSPEHAGTASLDVHNSAKEMGLLMVRVKQTGATLRENWYHDARLISKTTALKVMRNHEEVQRHIAACFAGEEASKC